MASKSKRRGRVFRASCILAALIIAGSSFAWFTSKDEVTNRLTATSDYGVSIVESYTPPKVWTPGQEVDKDVYAVNTGSIAAFVNEDVTGVLNYTYETLADSFSSAKGVKLNEKDITAIEAAGVTTYEAGSYLAWTSTTEERGEKIIKADGSGWKPTQVGTYIFRRSVKHPTTNGSTEPDTFEYAGYYFDGTDYYKIVIGKDNFPYAGGQAHEFDVSSGSLGENVEVDKDGKVTSGTPTVRYVNLEKVDNQHVTFLYEEKTTGYNSGKDYSDTNHPARLVVTSNDAAVTNGSNGNTYNASAEAARAEIDYRNNKKLSDDASKEYNQVKNDFDLANAIIGARNTLINAGRDRYAAHYQAEQDKTTSEGKQDAYTGRATAIKTDTTNYGNVYTNDATSGNIGKYALIPGYSGGNNTNLRARIAALPAGSNVIQNLTDFDDIYDNMYGTGGTASQITGKLQEIADLNDYGTENNTATARTAATKLNELLALINKMDGQLTDYDQTYATLKENSSDPAYAATNIQLDNDGAVHTAIEAVRSQLTALKNTLTVDVTGQKALSTLIAEFKTAATTMEASADTETNDANDAWKAAVDAYNDTVNEAYTNYKKYCTGSTSDGFQQVAQPDGTSYLTDNSGSISNTYGLTGSTALNIGTSPYINYTTIYDGTTPYNPAQTNDQDSGKPKEKMAALTDSYTGTGSTELSTLKSNMDAAVGNMNAAKTAYNNAVNRLTDDSAIKIYVNLAENYDTYWQFDPTTSGTTEASFYLKHILDAGKTSEQLIDSVTLADTVTAAAYKDMTFDLNVKLDSAQITYNADQTEITDEAVNANNGFGLKVKDGGIDQSTKAVTWNLPTN